MRAIDRALEVLVPRQSRRLLQRFPRLESLAKRALPHGAQLRVRGYIAKKGMVGFEERLVRHHYAGVELKILLADALGQEWYDQDWPSLDELELLSDHGLVVGARVFDIGAHQGVVALLLSHRVGDQGRVVAVEANPHDASVAKRNIATNRASNVDVVHAAVGRESGFLSFSLAGEVTAEPAASALRVPAVTIDQLAEQYAPPEILFIDVEGYECRVLEGSCRTLERRPAVFVEVHAGGNLERFGDTAEHVLAHFPPDSYLRWVKRDEEHGFQLYNNEELPSHRFFFIAVPRV